MKIIVDLIHPANFHYFKNFVSEMKSLGHEICVTARDKDVLYDLLYVSKTDFLPMGRPLPGFFGKILYTLYAELLFLIYSSNFKPDLIISFSSSYAAHSSFLLGSKHITFDDTEHAKLNRLLYLPFTETIFTPLSFGLDLGKKQIKFNSNMELAYLHPEFFKPEKSVLSSLSINEKTQYIIVRLVSWDAAHDFDQSGVSNNTLIKLVKLLSKRYKVFISSESTLPSNLEKFNLNISADKIHDILYFSSMYIGEGATMASESAILGTPSIYINTLTAGTIEEQENFGLLYRATTDISLIRTIRKVLAVGLNSSRWERNKEAYLESKINLTDYLVKFVVKNYTG